MAEADTTPRRTVAAQTSSDGLDEQTPGAYEVTDRRRKRAASAIAAARISSDGSDEEWEDADEIVASPRRVKFTPGDVDGEWKPMDVLKPMEGYGKLDPEIAPVKARRMAAVTWTQNTVFNILGHEMLIMVGGVGKPVESSRVLYCKSHRRGICRPGCKFFVQVRLTNGGFVVETKGRYYASEDHMTSVPRTRRVRLRGVTSRAHGTPRSRDGVKDSASLK